MSFTVTLSAVAVMLLYALPGFIIVKCKVISGDSIHNFSKVLLYICQPCLTFYSIQNIRFSAENAVNLALCFLIGICTMTGIILLFFFVMKRKREQIIWRIINLATAFSNCGFLGVPLLERMLPDHPEAIAYSAIFSVAMNMVGWSLGLYIISLDRRYISVKKLLINPCTLSLAAALPFFFAGISLPTFLNDAVTLVGRMSTPLCMIIMGMRLATVEPKSLFCDLRQYFAVFLNQIFYPLFVFLILRFIPIDETLKSAIVIMCACPIASIIQNFAEILGQGQHRAANMTLLGTIFSIVTVPLISLVL